MMSLRDSPIRRGTPPRPPWLLPVLIAVGALVVIGVVFALVSLVRGSSSDTASPASAAPSPCVTELVAPSQVLPEPSTVTVNVYNSTPKSGLAMDTAKELKARSFLIGKVANDPKKKTIKGVAQIRYGAKGEQAAQLLLFYVPGADLVRTGRKGATVDVAIGNTYSGLAPQQGIDALMASPKPIASGPACPPSSP
ncbi:MAG: LytR C-terminal domain-containing protein [Actinobacteria bacterium]|nr:LytR C-terminal domain-containing protein [Actinomycetota bacterium]